MSRYIPTYWYPDRMPVDISWVFENEVPAGAALSAGFRFSFGGTTDIEEVETESENVKAIYDLTGRKLESIAGPGIYIIDGKKVIVK